jgi:DNA-binding transcriptional LysR family regulator
MFMNYTLHQLQIFHKITQTHSITKAAEELHLTQPAVSIQLKNLQDQFAIPLTEVIGRKLFITDFGKEVAAASENILNEVLAINDKTLAYRGQLVGRLKISVVSTGKYVMPYFLVDFLQQHQGIELELDVTNKAKVIESLENNEVDFALMSFLPEHLQIEKIELLENVHFLVGSTELNFKSKIQRKGKEEIPFIYREQGSSTRRVMEKFIRQNNLPVRKKIELTSTEAVKQAVIAGLGCSILPLVGMKNELRNNELEIIPVNGLPLKTTWSLIWLKNKKLSPAAISYLDYLEKDKRRIIKKRYEGFVQTDI